MLHQTCGTNYALFSRRQRGLRQSYTLKVMAFLIGKQQRLNLKKKYNYHRTDAPQQRLTEMTNFQLENSEFLEKRRLAEEAKRSAVEKIREN